MSKKLKNTLALILSLATVFSAAFTSMADVAPVEGVTLDDQVEVVEAAESVTADILSAETPVEVTVEEVVEETASGAVSESEEKENGKLLSAGEPDWFCVTNVSDKDNIIGWYLAKNTEETPAPEIDLYYRVGDSEWKSWTFGYESAFGGVTEETGVKLGAGEKIYFKNNTGTFSKSYKQEEYWIPDYYSLTTANYEKISVSGDLTTLLSYDGNVTDLTAAGAGVFHNMFCIDNIVSVKDLKLPSTTLTPDCYSGMFAYLSQIKEAPLLPAEALAENCYDGMFIGCSSLAEAPALPVETLAETCYQSMFSGCSSLTEAPALPAETLEDSCYYCMFIGCSSLTEAPALPAETLAENCYNSMFSGCSSLTKAPALPAETLAKNCYYGMFSGCSSLTKAPALPAETLAETCYQSMFSGCSSLTEAPALPAETLADSCYSRMFYGCKSLTKAPALPALELEKYCYESMFAECYSLKEAPVLLAPVLVEGCYQSMFQGGWDSEKWPLLVQLRLDQLTSLVMTATDISAADCLGGWVFGVAENGIFYKAPSMKSLPQDEDGNGIPYNWKIVEFNPEITSFSTDKETYTEGDSVVFTVETENMPDGIWSMEKSLDGQPYGKVSVSITDGKAIWEEEGFTVGKHLIEIIIGGVKSSITFEVKKKADPTPVPTPTRDDDDDHELLFTGKWNNPVKNGSWSQDSHGIWHYASSETFRNTWGYIYNPYAHDGQNTSDWFWFDIHGNMLTGWQFINGKWYYLHMEKDGVLGSCLIGPAITPDGWTVDESGAWVESIPRKK